MSDEIVESEDIDDDGEPEVIELRSPDNKPWFTVDEFEAAHFHRALGYRFVRPDQGDRILSTH